MDRKLSLGKYLVVFSLTAGSLSGCVSQYGFQADPSIDLDGDGIPDPIPSVLPSEVPSVLPSVVPSPSVTVTPPAPSPSATPTPPPAPSPSPSPSVTATPSPSPTLPPPVVPSPSPSPSPTASPSPSPSSTPTPPPAPSASPSPAPVVKNGVNEFKPSVLNDVKIDMLFIVDNSGSMQENQAKLADSFGQFINEFIKRDVDFHIGVITTDVSSTSSSYWSDRLRGYVNPQMGCLVTKYSGERFLTKDTVQLVSKFQQNVKVGVRGNGSEQPLNSLSFALDGARTGQGGCNEGFFRPDALLWTGVVTDENEDIRNGETPSARVDRIINLIASKRGAESRGFRSDFIIDLDAVKPAAPITYPLSAAGGYNPYPEVHHLAAEKMKGRKINIASNFGKEIVTVGSDIINQAESEFKLTQVPLAGTLVVKVNGTVVIENDPNGYVYHADRNTIELKGAALAQSAGGTVTAEYKYTVD